MLDESIWMIDAGTQRPIQISRSRAPSWQPQPEAVDPVMQRQQQMMRYQAHQRMLQEQRFRQPTIRESEMQRAIQLLQQPREDEYQLQNLNEPQEPRVHYQRPSIIDDRMRYRAFRPHMVGPSGYRNETNRSSYWTLREPIRFFNPMSFVKQTVDNATGEIFHERKTFFRPFTIRL